MTANHAATMLNAAQAAQEAAELIGRQSVELHAVRARVAELEAALRGHFRDVLGDIADSHIADPERRHELIGDVVEALDEILINPRPYARLDEQVARNLQQQPGVFARPID